MGIFIGFVIFCTIMWVIISIGNDKEREQKEKQRVKEDEINNQVIEKLNELNFSATKKYYDPVYKGPYKAIAIDSVNKKIALILKSGYRIFSYRDILESKIIEDGEEITTTSRSSQVGRALVGGVLAGGVGAIIGGVGAKQKHSSDVNKITLKIVVNDIEYPAFKIEFLKLKDFETKVKKDDDRYKEAISEANKWHDIISVLIRQADEIDKKEEGHKDKGSVAEELTKFSVLMEKGIITKEEFENQKEKLLSGA